MDLLKKPVVIIIIIAVVIVLLITKTGVRKEGFAPMEPNLFTTPNYKSLEAGLWSSQWYQSHKDPVKQQCGKAPTKMIGQKETRGEILEELTPGTPIPRNVPMGQVETVRGDEDISQVGAPLAEVIRQEVALTQPLQFMSPELQEIMRQEQLRLNQLSSQYENPQNVVAIQPTVENRQDMTPELRQAEMEQRMRHMNGVEAEKLMEMAHQIHTEMAPETEYRHAEMVPEYNGGSLDDMESLVQELGKSEEKVEQELERKGELIEQELMPGMEQKAKLEQELSKRLGQEVVIQVKTDNNNLALAIFLSVLLVGFIYNTSEDY